MRPSGTLRVPLWQYHPGLPMALEVAAGQRVGQGDTLASPIDARGVPVRAPAAGTVGEVGPARVVGAGRPETQAVEIDTVRPDPARGTGAVLASRGTVRDRIRDGGLRGLGGASYPTHLKAGTGEPDQLVVNLMETDPEIACDRSAVRELGASAAVDLVAEVASLLGVRRALVASPRGAFFSGELSAAAAGAEVDLAFLPPHYALGHFRLLTGWLADNTRPGFPADSPPLVLNFGTVRAVHDALVSGRPLTSRLVTVCLPDAGRRVVCDVPFGTPLRDLLGAVPGGAGRSRARVGGIGNRDRLGLDDVVGPASNSVVAGPETTRRKTSLPCIGCNLCDAHCPAGISPRRLWSLCSAGRVARAVGDGLLDCVNCRACDLACPSRLPIADRLAGAIREHRASADLEARRRSARARHRPVPAGDRLGDPLPEEAYLPADLAGALAARAAGAADARQPFRSGSNSGTT